MILINQRGQRATGWCPLSLKCIEHARAESQLAAGDVAAIRERMDIYTVMSQRAWRLCRCDLWARIQSAVT